MNKEVLKKIYGNTFSFWAINKHFAKHIGLEATLLLQHLVDLDNDPRTPRFKGMIHPSYNEIHNDIHMSIKTIQRVVKQLKEHELLEIVFTGQPGCNHYNIDYINIRKLMESSSLPEFVQARDTLFGVASSNTSICNNLV